MGLTKYRLGDLIELSDIKNSDNKLKIDDVRGISIQKKFIDTKADMTNVSLTPYLVVGKYYFAYVPTTSRNGEKITIAYNETDDLYIVSSSYIVFNVKNTKILNSDFLFIYFNRFEFDRYSRFHSWGSARETFSWEEMCNLEIELPSIEIQQKYVDIYRAMKLNQQSYETGLEDLKLACDAYVEKLKKESPLSAITPYINRVDKRNSDNNIKNVMGISVYKQFRIPTSKVDVDNLSGYKIVEPRHISFVQTTHNEKVFAYAFNNTEENIVVSSVNEVFYTDEENLLPEYLCVFFNRTEFDRYARFHSWGSARETFTWSDLQSVKIPIPKIEIQQAIVDIYTAYQNRKEINERLKLQTKEICPILIKGALEEGAKLL